MNGNFMIRQTRKGNETSYRLSLQWQKEKIINSMKREPSDTARKG